MDSIKVTKFLGIALTAAVSLVLTGCLSDSESAEDPQNPSPPPPPSNSAPTISGSPSTAVTVGDAYTFTPQASDPDGDALTFSIQNRPIWASFDASTGTLSGTPGLGDIGNFDNIVISVSDGRASAAMNNFGVEVTQMALGSATLSWTPPTQNIDGSSLTDLVAYKIYVGTSPGSYSQEIRIDNPSISTFVVDNLVPDTYYFTATAVNSRGMESEFSNMATKVVN